MTGQGLIIIIIFMMIFYYLVTTAWLYIMTVVNSLDNSGNKFKTKAEQTKVTKETEQKYIDGIKRVIILFVLLFLVVSIGK